MTPEAMDALNDEMFAAMVRIMAAEAERARAAR
jgi:hypothetical protein